MLMQYDVKNNKTISTIQRNKQILITTRCIVYETLYHSTTTQSNKYRSNIMYIYAILEVCVPNNTKAVQIDAHDTA